MEGLHVWRVMSHASWAAWVRPEVVLAVATLFALYGATVGPVRVALGRQPARRREWICFLLGCVAVLAALGSPLAFLAAGYLLTAHMLQFVLLSMVAAPFMLSGLPLWVWDLLLPEGGVRKAAMFLGAPSPALAAVPLSFRFFQTPGLTDEGLHSPPLYAVQAGILMLAGLLLWWPVFGPRLTAEGAKTRLKGPVELVYLFLMGFPGLILASALVLFATGPVYPAYAPGEKAIGIPPLVDQILAGILMQTGMMLARSWIFARIGLAWGARQDAEERETRAGIVASSFTLPQKKPWGLRERPS